MLGRQRPGDITVEAALAPPAAVRRLAERRHEGIQDASRQRMPYIKAPATWTAQFVVCTQAVLVSSEINTVRQRSHGRQVLGRPCHFQTRRLAELYPAERRIDGAQQTG